MKTRRVVGFYVFLWDKIGSQRHVARRQVYRNTIDIVRRQMASLFESYVLFFRLSGTRDIYIYSWLCFIKIDTAVK